MFGEQGLAFQGEAALSSVCSYLCPLDGVVCRPHGHQWMATWLNMTSNTTVSILIKYPHLIHLLLRQPAPTWSATSAVGRR
jgi:hypothetical protein